LSTGYLAFAHAHRLDIVTKLKAEVPEGTKVPFATIAQAISNSWKQLPDSAKKKYMDESAAWVAIHGKTVKNTLPKGWTIETVAGKTIYKHAESGTATSRRPMSAERLKNKILGVKRPLGAYATFVKENFKRLGGMKECAEAWRAQKAKK
jgi:hypothetical protein